MRSHIAYLRIKRGDRFTVGFTAGGALFDETSGERIGRPLFVTDEGANLPVPLEMAGHQEWERTRLPLIGPVRFTRVR